MFILLSSYIYNARYGSKDPVPDAAAQPQASAPAPVKPISRAQALAGSKRVLVETPTLIGSLNLTGARLDDLALKNYHENQDAKASLVHIYSPEGTESAAYAAFTWHGEGVQAPDDSTVWNVEGADKLTPATPVTLSWTNGAHITYREKISVDDHFLFTVTQSVENGSTAPALLTRLAKVTRTVQMVDVPPVVPHTGPIAVENGKLNTDVSYDILDKKEPSTFSRIFGATAGSGSWASESKGGWLGFSDKYWLSALVPTQDMPSKFQFGKYGSTYLAGTSETSPQVVAAGTVKSASQRLFVGAKEINILDKYSATQNIPALGKVMDWGWFEIIAWPMYQLVHWLISVTGSVGIAIILTTFVVRILMLPIAFKQFGSMLAMKEVQPKMKALQERLKDKPEQLRLDMAKLYKEEKINPLAGCLPIFFQIPVFYALYKALTLTIDLRQAHFLWITDLSQADHIFFNLAPGLETTLSAILPSFMLIGVLPILNGVTMWLIQKVSPTPITDPSQATMMKIMPWMMMFLFASFPAGLALYYVVSNTITIAQQYYFFSRHPQLKAQAS